MANLSSILEEILRNIGPPLREVDVHARLGLPGVPITEKISGLGSSDEWNICRIGEGRDMGIPPAEFVGASSNTEHFWDDRKLHLGLSGPVHSGIREVLRVKESLEVLTSTRRSLCPTMRYKPMH